MLGLRDQVTAPAPPGRAEVAEIFDGGAETSEDVDFSP